MSEQTVINPLDALHNALGNYADGSISAEALARVANEANTYIIQNGLDRRTVGDSTVIKGWVSMHSSPDPWFSKTMFRGQDEPYTPATLILGNGFSEEQVRKMLEEITVAASENARSCYTNRIAQMTPPPPIRLIIQTIASKYGIEL